MEKECPELIEIDEQEIIERKRPKRAARQQNAEQLTRQERWRAICQDFERSGKNSRSYSIENQQNYYQLKYWHKKFALKQGRTGAGKFVEVKLPRLPETASYKITLTNGIQLELGNSYRAEKVAQLLELLRC